MHHLDHAVAEVVEALNESGQRAHTIILFSSDNGPWRDNAGGGYPDNYPLKDYNQPDNKRGKKLDVWEGGIHVAGFIHWPGKIKSRAIEEYVHIIDWFPTLANIVDIHPEPKVEWDGIDLSPLLFGEGSLNERSLYWIWHPNTNRWALRFGDWKIVKYGTGEPQKPEDWGLYNLENDPEEKHNFAEQHPEKLKQLHGMFLEQHAKDKI